MTYQHKTEDQIKSELKNGKKTHDQVQEGMMSCAHLREQLDEIQEEVGKICNLQDGTEKNERKQTIFSILSVLKEQLNGASIQLKSGSKQNANFNSEQLNNKNNQSASGANNSNNLNNSRTGSQSIDNKDWNSTTSKSSSESSDSRTR